MPFQIEDLPDTVLLTIFSLLASQRLYNLLRLRLVCTRWRDLATDSILWRRIAFPNNPRFNIEVLKSILSWCTNVKKVDLNWCPLVGDDSLQVIAENCPKLRILKVKNCKVSDFGLEKISSSCLYLRALTISYHDEVSVTAKTVNKLIKNSPQLEELRIFRKEEDESSDHVFKISPELSQTLLKSRLKVFRCESPAFDSEDIFRIPTDGDISLNLEKLFMPSCTDLSNRLLCSLSNRCSYLKVLDISHCPGVNDSGLIAFVETCPLLEHVNVMACQCVTDIAIESIARHCKNLEFLCLAGCELPRPMGNITDVAIQTVANFCTKIKYLNVKWCQGVTDIGIGAIATNCPHLSHLNVSGCLAISDVSMLVVAAHCKNLKSLEVTECLRITCIGINSIVQNCLQLIHLDMQVCSYLTQLDFRCSASTLPLRHLDLSYCTKITDECIKYITLLCHELNFLSLAGCHRITSTSMKYIAQNCHALQYLDVSYRGSQSSIHLRGDSIVFLARHCPHLTYLDLIGCWNVTKECVQLIVEGCKYLSQLIISQVCKPGEVCSQGEQLQNMALQYRFSCEVVRVSKSIRSGKLTESFILYMSALVL